MEHREHARSSLLDKGMNIQMSKWPKNDNSSSCIYNVSFRIPKTNCCEVVCVWMKVFLSLSHKKKNLPPLLFSSCQSIDSVLHYETLSIFVANCKGKHSNNNDKLSFDSWRVYWWCCLDNCSAARSITYLCSVCWYLGWPKGLHVQSGERQVHQLPEDWRQPCCCS